MHDATQYIQDFCRCLRQEAVFDDYNGVFLIGESFGLWHLETGEWVVESYRQVGGTYYDPPDVAIIEHGTYKDLKKALRKIGALLVLSAFEVADEGEAMVEMMANEVAAEEYFKSQGLPP